MHTHTHIFHHEQFQNSQSFPWFIRVKAMTIYFLFKISSFANNPQLHHCHDSCIWVLHALEAAQRQSENDNPVQKSI